MDRAKHVRGVADMIRTAAVIDDIEVPGFVAAQVMPSGAAKFHAIGIGVSEQIVVLLEEYAETLEREGSTP